MITFHSSGTPIGALLVMEVCRPSIRITPTRVTVPPRPASSTIGIENSSRIPAWAIDASRDGVRSSGQCRYVSFRSQAHRVQGLLLVITQTTAGKWRLSLVHAAQNHSAAH